MHRIVRGTICVVPLLACASSSGDRGGDETGTGTGTDEGASSLSRLDETIGTSLEAGSEGDASSGDDETGDDGPAEPAWGSGSRMRARVLDGGGGALRQSGWHDTQLDLDCNIAPVGDGEGRCVPGPIYGVS